MPAPEESSRVAETVKVSITVIMATVTSCNTSTVPFVKGSEVFPAFSTGAPPTIRYASAPVEMSVI